MNFFYCLMGNKLFIDGVMIRANWFVVGDELKKFLLQTWLLDAASLLIAV